MAVVVVVDLSVDTAALLIQLLLVGPLIAALGATTRQTIFVSVLAVAISMPLGANTDAFGSDRYFVATGVLLIGGALAILIARLRHELERDSARLSAQYGVARAIATADNFDEAAPSVLESIARPLGRQVANFWAPDDDGALRCVAQWHESGMNFDEFQRAARELVLRPGEGFPGQAWQTERPVWLATRSPQGSSPAAPRRTAPISTAAWRSPS